jgi:hypothetical protein
MDSPQPQHTYAFESCSASLHSRSCLQGNMLHVCQGTRSHSMWDQKWIYTKQNVKWSILEKGSTLFVPFYRWIPCTVNEGTTPLILKLGTRWRWGGSASRLICFTPDKQLLTAAKQRLGGPICIFWKWEKFLAPFRNLTMIHWLYTL